MVCLVQLHFSPLSGHHRVVVDTHGHNPHAAVYFTWPVQSQNRSLTNPKLSEQNNFQKRFQLSFAGGDGGNGVGRRGGGHGRDENWGHDDYHEDFSSSSQALRLLGLLVNRWISWVLVDPHFPLRILMEDLAGVIACVVGDMALSSSFVLNELDFICSSLVVGSILNFRLMYQLAPSIGSCSYSLPAIFTKTHLLALAALGIPEPIGIVLYRGTVSAAVAFAAGIVGSALSNGLIHKIDFVIFFLFAFVVDIFISQ